MIGCCTDGIRPVIFRIEKIDLVSREPICFTELPEELKNPPTFIGPVLNSGYRRNS